MLAVLALAIGALGALAGVALPGTALARAIGGRIVCALELSGGCGPLGASDLVLAYGEELAALVAQTAPQIRYEPGMRALPVDFRHCREDECAEGRDGIRVARSQTAGADCSGDAAGNSYLQYWLYYPGSATGEGSSFLRGAIRELSEQVGHPTYHPDDWESVQFRIHPDGSAEVRASAHYGYGAGWQPAEDSAYTVAGGSHAGTVEPAAFDRITTPRRLGLVALEPLAADDPRAEFAITPPWRKRVWLDPEYEGTD